MATGQQSSLVQLLEEPRDAFRIIDPDHAGLRRRRGGRALLLRDQPRPVDVPDDVDFPDIERLHQRRIGEYFGELDCAGRHAIGPGFMQGEERQPQIADLARRRLEVGRVATIRQRERGLGEEQKLVYEAFEKFARSSMKASTCSRNQAQRGSE